jgi:hypothetical protein
MQGLDQTSTSALTASAMNGELSGSVVVIPRTRPGFEQIVEPVPCLVGHFYKSGAYYSVDSAYLAYHFPELAAELGSSWYWNAADLSAQTSRELHDGDIPRTLPPRLPSARFPRPELSDQFPKSIGEKIKVTRTHVLCASARDDCSAEVHDEAFAAHAKLKSQLITPATSLLFQGFHRQLMNELGSIGIKRRRKLILNLARCHRATKETQAYAPYVGIVEHTVQPEIGLLLAQILAAGGFVARADGTAVASDGSAVIAVCD